LPPTPFSPANSANWLKEVEGLESSSEVSLVSKEAAALSARQTLMIQQQEEALHQREETIVQQARELEKLQQWPVQVAEVVLPTLVSVGGQTITPPASPAAEIVAANANEAKGKCGDMESALSALQSQLKEKEAELTSAKADLDRSSASEQALQSQLRAIQEEVSSASESMASAEAARASATEALQRQLAVAQANIAAEAQKVADAEKKMEEMSVSSPALVSVAGQAKSPGPVVAYIDGQAKSPPVSPAMVSPEGQKPTPPAPPGPALVSDDGETATLPVSPVQNASVQPINESNVAEVVRPVLGSSGGKTTHKAAIAIAQLQEKLRSTLAKEKSDMGHTGEQKAHEKKRAVSSLKSSAQQVIRREAEALYSVTADKEQLLQVQQRAWHQATADMHLVTGSPKKDIPLPEGAQTGSPLARSTSLSRSQRDESSETGLETESPTSTGLGTFSRSPSSWSPVPGRRRRGGPCDTYGSSAGSAIWTKLNQKYTSLSPRSPPSGRMNTEA